MSWNVAYTAGARRDLRRIYEYIAYVLLAPETAAGMCADSLVKRKLNTE